jgi:fructose-bisphosphate aldolase class II
VKSTAQIIRSARAAGIAVPAFNIPYLPMVQPVVRAVRDEDSFALVQVARLEWEKFSSRSLEAVAEEFHRHQDPAHVRLHLDHVPVLDEDGRQVDYLPILRRAIAAGYQSLMVDGSRLALVENIRATRAAAELSHAAGLPCEAELGAVLGHEEGPLPPYEELFASGRGFTDPGEAERFVRESDCDWLSVAIGNIHGAISKAARDQKKVEARLDLQHLARLAEAARVPLVLHGGSGIRPEDLRLAFAAGIAKLNVGTEIRQAYEAARRETGSQAEAQEAVYRRTRSLLAETYRLGGSRAALGAED